MQTQPSADSVEWGPLSFCLGWLFLPVIIVFGMVLVYTFARWVGAMMSDP